MAVPLKHIGLLLDEPLISRLEEESRLRQASVSEVVRELLARDLGVPKRVLDTSVVVKWV